MGAAIALQAAAKDDTVCAAAVESSFASFREIAYDRVSQWTGLSLRASRMVGPPVIDLALLYVRVRYGVDLTNASPELALSESSAPILIIADKQDHNIPPRQATMLAQYTKPLTPCGSFRVPITAEHRRWRIRNFKTGYCSGSHCTGKSALINLTFLLRLSVFRDCPMTKIQWLRRINVIMFTLNVLGAVLYVWWASRGWRNPQEKGMVPITGEPFVWAVGVFPIWAIFLLLNAIWGLLIIRSRQWRSGSLWLLNVPIWLIAVAIDFMHH